MGRRRAENDPAVRTELTDRQREVLSLMAKGSTNVEIAERLGLSLDGAKWHVREIFGRLGVESREEAVQWWLGHRRRHALAWIPIASIGAVAAAAVVAVGIFASTRNGTDTAVSDASSTPLPTSTATPTPVVARITPTPLKEQPSLREVASGDVWRLSFADDGLTLPPVSELMLAINWDIEHPLVDVLSTEGKLVARIQVGYRPVAHLNPRDGTLVISDVAHPDGGERARILVFDLGAKVLLKDITLPQRRMNPIIFADSIALSPNGEWLYWVEPSITEPASCLTINGAAHCDQAIIHAMNLKSREAANFSVPMPVGCGVPAFAQYEDAAIVVQCAPIEGTRGHWTVDATRPRDPLMDAPANAPRAYWEWSAGRVDGLVLSRAITNLGDLTSVALRDVVTGDIRAEMQVTNTWGALLLNPREVLFLRSSGRLERVDIFTGAGTQLPYAIDPGRQGLDIALIR